MSHLSLSGLYASFDVPTRRYVIIETAPNRYGIGSLVTIAMTKNATEAEVLAGVHKYVGSSRSMECRGMEAGLERLSQIDGIEVVAFVTDGDTGARNTLTHAHMFLGRKEGYEWHHLYDANHKFKNLYVSFGFLASACSTRFIILPYKVACALILYH